MTCPFPSPLPQDPDLALPDKKKNKPTARRNSEVTATLSGTYRNYNLGDVVRVCQAVERKEIKLEWLKPSNANHDPVTMNVPRTTAQEYLEDDHK